MKEYTFRVKVEEDGDRWFAYCPLLQKYGAATWGNTYEEAYKHIEEVVQMVVEELIEDGEPIPESPIWEPDVPRDLQVQVKVAA